MFEAEADRTDACAQRNMVLGPDGEGGADVVL